MSHTLADRVEALFRSRPNEWIDARMFLSIGGSMAWRTRISDVRTQRGMTIENRTRRIKGREGQLWTVSEYRWVTPTIADAADPGFVVQADGQSTFL